MDTKTLGSVSSRGVGRPDYSAAYSPLFTTDYGYATSGSMTTLVDTTKNWQVNIWRNAAIDLYIGGTKYSRYVISNTATALTFATITPATVIGGVQYALRERVGISSNRIAIYLNQVPVPAPGTRVQLPDVTVPDGFHATLTGIPDNAALISVYNVAVGGTAVLIDAGFSRPFSITNLNLLWIDATNAGDGVDIQVEQ
jgi:hypothetical protein